MFKTKSSKKKTNALSDLSTAERDAEYRKAGEESWDEVWAILQDTDGWNIDKGKDLETGIVYSKSIKGIGRVSKMEMFKTKSSKKKTNALSDLSTAERDAEYRKTGEESWDEVWAILQDTNGWNTDKGKDLETGIVYSKSIKGIGRVSKMECRIPLSPEGLFDLIVRQTETSPSWDPAVVESKVIHTISDHCDLHYLVTREIMGGVVARRDYVNARVWKTKDGVTMSVGAAVKHPDTPPVKNIVRGKSKAMGCAFSAVEGDPDSCFFQWIMSIDIGGWIPKWTVDQGIATSLLDFLKHCKTKVEDVKSKDAAVKTS